MSDHGSAFASTYARILRRETHSPRSVPAITLAVLLILLCAWVATESVLLLLDQPALVAAPADVAESTARATELDAAILIAAGVVAVILGLILIVLALTPGRRARHSFRTDRSAVVVDNEVIASAVARRAAHAGNSSPDNTSVAVSHRRATVNLTPSSGYPVDEASIHTAVDEELARIDAHPRLAADVTVAPHGKVGA